MSTSIPSIGAWTVPTREPRKIGRLCATDGVESCGPQHRGSRRARGGAVEATGERAGLAIHGRADGDHLGCVLTGTRPRSDRFVEFRLFVRFLDRIRAVGIASITLGVQGDVSWATGSRHGRPSLHTAQAYPTTTPNQASEPSSVSVDI